MARSKPEPDPDGAVVESVRGPDGLTRVKEGDKTPVRMFHPELKALSKGTVPRWTFDGLWSRKGWLLYNPEEHDHLLPRGVAPQPAVDPEPSKVEPADGAKDDTLIINNESALDSGD